QDPQRLARESLCRRAVRRAPRPLCPERPGRQLFDRQSRQTARAGGPATASVLFQEIKRDEPRQPAALCSSVLRLHVRVQRLALYLTVLANPCHERTTSPPPDPAADPAQHTLSFHRVLDRISQAAWLCHRQGPRLGGHG